MDEVFKPRERLKLSVVIKNCCRQKPSDALLMMILEADLYLPVLKRGNLFDENPKLTVTELNISVRNCCDYSQTFSPWARAGAWYHSGGVNLSDI